MFDGGFQSGSGVTISQIDELVDGENRDREKIDWVEPEQWGLELAFSQLELYAV